MIADRLIAHRGCALLRPENTLEAMRVTADLGVPWVEIDANLLGDGTAIMFHDDYLDRLTNGSGPLAACNWQDVATLDVGSHFSTEYSAERIPRLDDAVALIDELRLGLNLEIKLYPHYAVADILPPVVAVLEKSWSRFDNLIISSFSTEALRALRALQPDWQLGQLWERIPADWAMLAEELGLVSIHCDYRYLDVATIAAIKAAGLDLYCYTVNDPTAGQVLLKAGVDGLITDNPLLFNLQD
ncbi:glycerophosphoryl diester phosphodiesterase [Natronospirillum operosum]|uniref:Glycerophosphoryl diester phosphodiesterase n=1 Tax=Natronospirillum operosum TaxID=2759953 RepID=A0A4Z0W661_9GAMM|nr:glycerophosphodiester phosphodiesterase family protein [Natronospirillum operosum]TGG90254.1 glycerophosphoryl diester phosphodiesterase [Natronospirillum operosum]